MRLRDSSVIFCTLLIAISCTKVLVNYTESLLKYATPINDYNLEGNYGYQCTPNSRGICTQTLLFLNITQNGFTRNMQISHTGLSSVNKILFVNKSGFDKVIICALQDSGEVGILNINVTTFNVIAYNVRNVSDVADIAVFGNYLLYIVPG